MAFKPATRQQVKLRMGLIGPAGSGKTFTSLRLAHGLVPNARIAVIDTEYGSACKYAGEVNPDGGNFEFDVMEFTEDFSPERYVQGIKEAEQAGYDILIIDSLSHAWEGSGGILDQVDQVAARMKGGSSFNAWRDVTPRHKALVEALLSAKLHLICTMRAKTEYVLEKDEKGKTVPRKIGLKAIQRDGMEYEFDLVGDIDHENRIVITKSRCSALSGRIIDRPGLPMATTLRTWLTSGSVAVVRQEEPNADAADFGWTAESRARFAEAIEPQGLTVDQFGDWCTAHSRPRPEHVSDTKRTEMVQWLNQRKGAETIRRWLADRTASAK